VFRKGSRLKEFLLAKLINAESACYKAERFSTLQRRTRQTLLSNLVNELHRQTEIYTSPLPYRDPFATASSISSTSSGFISSMKKALLTNTRSKSQGPPEGRFMKISSSKGGGHKSSSSASSSVAADCMMHPCSTTSTLTSSGRKSSLSTAAAAKRTQPQLTSRDSGHGESSDNSVGSGSPDSVEKVLKRTTGTDFAKFVTRL
jgi:hypothetical protein